MAPLNMERLKELCNKVDEGGGIEELEETEAEDWYNTLCEVSVDDEKKPEKLKLLFTASRAIMQFKTAQVVAISDAAEEEATKSSEEIEKLEMEKEGLQSELSQLRIQIGGASGIADKSLTDEIESLREENDKIKLTQRDRLRELTDSQKEAERLRAQTLEKEKDLKELKERLFESDRTIAELRRKLQTMQDSSSGKSSIAEQTQKKLKDRTEQLLNITDELTNVNHENEMMRDQVDELRGRLAEAVTEMELTTDTCQQLKDNLRVSDDVIEALQQENEALKKQLESAGMPTSQSSAYDDLIAAVDRKIEEWKGLLQEKDQEIASGKKEIEALQQEVSNFAIDSDKTSISALTKALEDRDQQIKILKQQLEEATTEMRETSSIAQAIQQQLSSDDSATAKHKNRTVQLEKSLKMREKALKAAEEKAAEAVKAAAQRDTELSDAIRRMQAYEMGEYGLADAVKEISELKIQLEFRDKQIAEQNAKCNEYQIENHDLEVENHDFRSRLGMDERKKGGKTGPKHEENAEKARALNIVLQKEVDKLEDERIELKLQLRKASQKIGQRAAALGLGAEDLMILEEFTEDLKRKREQALKEWKTQQVMDKHATTTQLIHSSQGSEEQSRKIVETTKMVNSIKSDNETLRKKLASVETENVHLIQGLKALKQSLQEGKAEDTPQIGKLIQILEKRGTTGNGEEVPRWEMKRAEGRNEELRSELQTTLNKWHEAKSQLENSQKETEILLRRLEVAEEKKESFHPITLPEGVPPSGSHVIMNLNARLMELLHEISLKEEQMKSMESVVQNYQSKIAVLKHTQGLVYQEFHDAKSEWTKEKAAMSAKRSELEENMEKSQINIQEFHRYLDTRSSSPEEIERRLAEMTRRYTAMRINEKIITRKYRALEDEYVTSRKQLERREREKLALETTVAERLGHLQKEKDIASFEIESLQKRAQDSVPLSDLKNLKQDLEEAMRKLRVTNDENIRLKEKAAKEPETIVALKRLEREKTYLSELLQAEKEKSAKYQALVNVGKLPGQPILQSANPDSQGLDSLAKKLAIVEMKEIHERERAEHAENLQKRQKDELSIVEQRNETLQRNVQELGKQMVEIEKSESALKEELQDSVSQKYHQKILDNLEELEKVNAKLEAELHGMKSVSDIARHQTNHWQKVEKLHTTEMQELRSTIRDLGAETDQKAVIGRLHRELIHFKLGEVETEEDIKAARERIRGLEARLLRSQQLCDNKDRANRMLRHEFSSKIGRLRKTVLELRTRYAHAVTMEEQESHQALVSRLQTEREKIREQLVSATEKSEQYAVLSEELKIQKSVMEETVASLKGAKGVQFLQKKWLDEIQNAKAVEMRVGRKNKIQEEQLRAKNNEISLLETHLRDLESRLISQSRSFDEQEMQWERRESELERQLLQQEMIERSVEIEISEITLDDLGLPDPTLPISQQLLHAKTSLSKHIRTSAVRKAELVEARKKAEELEIQVRKLRTQALINDQMYQTRIISSKADSGLELSTDERKDFHDTMNFLQRSVKALQDQLNEKEETVESFKHLLDETQRKFRDREFEHQKELLEIRREVDAEKAKHVAKWKADSDRIMARSSQDSDGTAELMKIVELESIITGLESSMTEHLETEKHLRAEMDSKDARIAELEAKLHLPQISSRTVDRPKTGASRRESEISARTHSIKPPSISGDSGAHPGPSARQGQRESLKIPIKTEEESARSTDRRSISISSEDGSEKPDPKAEKHSPPSKPSESFLEMKVTAQRLRSQLQQTKKENQKLKKALDTLKSDMGRPPPRPVSSVSDMNHEQLEQRIDELNDNLNKERHEIERRKNKEASLIQDIKDLKSDLDRRSGVIERMKEERESLQRENEANERRMANMRDFSKHKLVVMENKKQAEKIVALQNQLDVLKKTKAEAPLEEHEKKSSSAVLRWETNKKLEQANSRLKKKLAEKTQEAESAETLITRLRGRISRLEQEQQMFGESMTMTKKKKFTENLEQSGRRDRSPLAEENRALKDEIRKLKSNTWMAGNPDMEQMLAKLEAENLRLEEQCYSLEAEVETLRDSLKQFQNSSKTSTRRKNSDTQTSTSPKGNASSDPKLRKVMKNLEEERDKALEEAQSAREKSRESNEALQVQIHTLQTELDSALQENEEIQQLHDRTGAIGTINRLHENMGSLEKENKELRKQLEEMRMNSSRISDPDVQSLVRENKALKSKLVKAGPRVAWAEEVEVRFTNGKMHEDSQLLISQLEKEQEENRKLKSRLVAVQESFDQLQGHVRRVEKLSSQRRAWQPTLPKEKPTARSPTHSTIHHRTNRAETLEKLLRTEIEKQYKLLYENKILNRKVEGLEWSSPIDMTPTDCTNMIKRQKGQLVELEAENERLEQELYRLRRYIEPAVDEHGLELRMIEERMKNYERVMKENVDLRLDVANLRDPRCTCLSPYAPKHPARFDR